jgi:thiamine pyrophosphokinase
MNIKNENIEIYEIDFDKNFDAIVCLDADLPGKEVFERLSGLPKLAADGSAIKLYKMGIIPNFVIGDLDTFNQSGYSEFFKAESIIYNPEQETNDFEKTLIFASGKLFQNILIFGFHGGELEHTLNNWSVLMKFALRLNLYIYDRKRFGIPVFTSIRFKAKIGETISIIPQPYSIITTKNLHWNLNQEKLELGVREGARNIAENENIEIILHEGSYLLFLDDRLK